jgi:hypothetical protein
MTQKSLFCMCVSLRQRDTDAAFLMLEHPPTLRYCMKFCVSVSDLMNKNIKNKSYRQHISRKLQFTHEGAALLVFAMVTVHRGKCVSG